MKLPKEIWQIASEALTTGMLVVREAAMPPLLPASELRASVAVIVTCHSKYLGVLRECLDTVEAQTEKANERILVLDGCRAPRWMKREPYRGWCIVRGKWGTPNPGRNAGIEVAQSDWIVIVDGDNWLRRDYLEGARDTIAQGNGSLGIVYADIIMKDNRHDYVSEHATPDVYDYWSLRLRNYVSSTSVWRRNAVIEAGGFQRTGCYDDWTVALNMTALGWTAAKQSIPILAREGNGGHRRDKSESEWGMKWEQRSYGIVTLLAGRDECLQGWLDWLEYADLPPKTALYVVDSSGRSDFGSYVRDCIGNPARSDRFTHIDYTAVPKPTLDINESYARARIVPCLYNQILPRVREDMLVTLEDDVVPPLSGLRDIVSIVGANSHIGAMAGAYLSRCGGNRICAAIGRDYIDGRVYLRDIKPKPMRVGCTGGGFTVYQNALIQRALPMRFDVIDGTPTGWDTIICNAITDQGYSIFMHGGVWCEHKGQAVA